MSTRSLTRVLDEDAIQVLNMYRQSDGYPTGMGKDLYEFIKDFSFCNGIGIDTVGEPKLANGAGCFAAQLVAHFKDGVGHIYLVAGNPGNHGQDYEYQICFKEDPKAQPTIRVRDRKKNVLFDGSIEAFGVFCEKDDE